MTIGATMQDVIVSKRPIYKTSLVTRIGRHIGYQDDGTIHISAGSLISTLQNKVGGFPVTGRDVTYQTLPDRDNFPVRESLVSDISARDSKTANLFLQWRIHDT